MGSSRPSLPWSASCSTPVTVNVFVTLPIRLKKSVFIGAPVALSATPAART